MNIEELQDAWQHLRAEQEQPHLSGEHLYAMLPSDRAFSLRRVMLKTTHYVGVYGSLMLCCQTC